MVQAAEYIYKKLREENLLSKAFNWRPEVGTDKYSLVNGSTLTARKRTPVLKPSVYTKKKCAAVCQYVTCSIVDNLLVLETDESTYQLLLSCCCENVA